MVDEALFIRPTPPKGYHAVHDDRKQTMVGNRRMAQCNGSLSGLLSLFDGFMKTS